MKLRGTRNDFGFDSVKDYGSVIFDPVPSPSTSTSLPIPDPVAIASGLFIMPPPRLKNQYYLVRSGESEFESMGVINTNPVDNGFI